MKLQIGRGIRFSMFILLCTLCACTKHTTPKKVNKRLTEGVWKMSQVNIDGTNITSQYNGVKFTFATHGSISVSGTLSSSGTWSTGDDKNPVVMFLTFAPNTSLYQFSDDWLVTEISKTECVLNRNESSTYKDKIIFRRID